MRVVVIGLATLMTVMSASIGPASAEPRPWCLQAGRGGPGGGLLDCTYHTLQQCLGSVGGGTDSCTRNPALLWDQREGKRTRQPPQGRGGSGY
jgi:hypothetical protein